MRDVLILPFRNCAYGFAGTSVYLLHNLFLLQKVLVTSSYADANSPMGFMKQGRALGKFV